jgi:flagellin-like hook-associated protein FlgL
MATLIYRLPLSRIRISGTRSETHDTVLDDSTAREASAVLGVMADPRVQLAIDLDHGTFEDSDATFSLTDDGRLTGATMSVTGQASAVVSAVVGVAATIIGVGVRAATGMALSSEPTDQGEAPTPVEKVEAAYEAARAPEFARRKAAMATLASLRAARQAVLKQIAETGEGRSAATVRQMVWLTAAIGHAESDVDRENDAMQAWRDTTITTETVAYTIDITLDELRASDAEVRDNKLYLPPPHVPSIPGQEEAQSKIRDAWDKLGCLVIVEDDPAEVYTATPVVGDRDSHHLYVRLPRSVNLQFYERSDADGTARLIREEPALVMDARSREQGIAQERVLFGKQSRGLTFSSDGNFTGLSFGSTSAAAAALTAVGGIPGQVATALDNVSKVSTSLGTLASAGDEAELQRLKRQVDTKTQELNLEGLERTSKDYAELEWLKQQASMKEQRDKAFPTAPAEDPVAKEIADLRQQVQIQILRGFLDDRA